ncbi:hypothetical protein HDU67_009034 [Dinochytrium kinnereticum]|nr:hypothetical protein HDU67_009034 [Dinochytrium kinnereticum]
MRDGKLGAGARALILRSCDLLLADAILPTRTFKNYVPRTSDNPIYQATNLPRRYETTEEEDTPPASILRRTARTHSRESVAHEEQGAETQAEAQEASRAPDNETRLTTTPLSRLTATIQELSDDSNVHVASGPDRKKDFVDDLRHMDTEWSMRTMDHLFNASFTDFVRNDKNCDCTGRHLARVVKEFKLDQVVMGIRWLIEGWPIESTAKLLKAVFDDWLPELAALAIGQIGTSWPLRPKMGLIVAYLMMGEKVSVVALFIKSLTIGWSPGSVTELISCLDTVLEWDDKFFNDFTEVFINELIEGKDHGETSTQDPEIMVRALAAMYKTSIASTNYRILLADFRLSIAKSNYLSQYNHFLSCPQCIRQERCPFTETSFNPRPSGIVRATRNSTHDLPMITQASLGSLRLALAPSILVPATSLSHRISSAQSLPLRLGSAISSIGSIATPSILRSSTAGLEGADMEDRETHWSASTSSWSSHVDGRVSRPGSEVVEWRGMTQDDELHDDDDDDDEYSDDFYDDDDATPRIIQLPRRHMTPLPPIPRGPASAPASMSTSNGIPASGPAFLMNQGGVSPAFRRQISRTNGCGSGSHSRSASNGKPVGISESRSASSVSFDPRDLDEPVPCVGSRASSGFF